MNLIQLANACTSVLCHTKLIQTKVLLINRFYTLIIERKKNNHVKIETSVLKCRLDTTLRFIVDKNYCYFLQSNNSYGNKDQH